MEMGNVPKRQQPDPRTDNSRRSPVGVQCSEKLPHQSHPYAGPKTNIYTSTVIMDAILNSEHTQETKIENHTRLTKARGFFIWRTNWLYL